jgi:hypothetical protein
MRRFLPFLILCFSCAPAKSPAVAPPAPSPQLSATGVAQRVVLLSFDGLGADALAAQGGLTAFDHLATHGATARVIPVNPTVTSSTHTAILTGRDPQRSGVVSNRFHAPGTPMEAIAKGMDADIDVETLVDAARKQGKRVGAVSFPTVDARTPKRTADFGVVWSEPAVPARLVRLTRPNFTREWVPPTWTSRPQRHVSYSPVMRSRFEWSAPGEVRLDVDLVAYDTTDDSRENYDSYTIEAGDREIVPDSHGWFAISARGPDGLYGSWSKLFVEQPLGVTVYWGAISHTNAYPAEYRAMLDDEVGFYPGAPDERSPIDPETFSEQVVRVADFMTRMQTATIRRMQFDLLLAYQPEIDAASHKYLGTREGTAVIREAFAAANRAVAGIGGILDVSRDALIVTGDHGFSQSLREVRLNRMLADAGLGARWHAYVSGSVAHLYRFDTTDDSDTVVKLLTATGLFEQIEKKTSSMHRNSGDIVAYAQSDIDLSASSEPPAIAPPMSNGHHGGLNTHRELHTALFAAGAGVPSGALGEIPQTAIAPFVAQLLGIRAPQ